MVPALLTFAAAHAAGPEFHGPHPDDVALAGIAWEAATECAGWEARHHPVVELVYEPEPNGWAGHASKDSAGLYQIAIHQRSPRVVVHEVAHAWPSSRTTTPNALTEGLTDLLVRCIARQRPELALRLRTPADTPRIDLVWWTNPHEATPEQRTAGYEGALALASAAADLVGERALWPADSRLVADWQWLFGLIHQVRPVTERHWAVIAALGPAIDDADLDGDGIPTGQERRLGLYPWAFDSDGDGSQDGLDEFLLGRKRRVEAVETAPVAAADRPQARPSQDNPPKTGNSRLPRHTVAFALPPDGRPVCSGWRATEEIEVSWRLEGDMAGVTQVKAMTRREHLTPTAAGTVHLPAGQGLLVAGELTSPDLTFGTAVIVIQTAELEPDPDCATPRIVPAPIDPVRPPRPEQPAWQPAALAKALEAGRVCAGRPPRREVDASDVPTPEGLVDRAASAWDPDARSDLDVARRYLLLGRCIGEKTEVALSFDNAPYLASWLQHLSDRVPEALTDWALGTADLSKKWAAHADPVVRALLATPESERTPLDTDDDGVPAFAERALGMSDDDADSDEDGIPDRVARWRGGEAATLLGPEPVWRCSGFRLKAGEALWTDAPEVAVPALVERWDDEARVVQGTGAPLFLWQRVPDRGCGEAGGMTWITTDGRPAHPELVAALAAQRPGNLQFPVPLALGGPATGVWHGGVRVSDALLAWANRTRRWELLTGLVGILANAADLGAPLDTTRVTEELLVRFGAPIPEISLTPAP